MLGKSPQNSVLPLPEDTFYLKLHDSNLIIQPISPEVMKRVVKMNQDVNLNPEKSSIGIVPAKRK